MIHFDMTFQCTYLLDEEIKPDKTYSHNAIQIAPTRKVQVSGVPPCYTLLKHYVCEQCGYAIGRGVSHVVRIEA